MFFGSLRLDSFSIRRIEKDENEKESYGYSAVVNDLTEIDGIDCYQIEQDSNEACLTVKYDSKKYNHKTVKKQLKKLIKYLRTEL